MRGSSSPISRVRQRSEAASALAVGKVDWVDEVLQIWESWTQRHGFQGFSLDLVLNGRVQDQEFSYPFRERFIDPYFPQKGQLDVASVDIRAKYMAWKSAGVLDAVLEHLKAAAASLPSRNLQMLMADAAGRAKERISRSAIQDENWIRNISAFAAYNALVEDSSVIEDILAVVPADSSIEADASAVLASVVRGVTENRARFTKEILAEYDSLFVGHSKFHANRPLQLWEDPSDTIGSFFSDLCARPLFNDAFPHHRDDLCENIVDMDEETLCQAMPVGHFKLVSFCGFFPTDIRRGIANMRTLLRPGGVLAIYPRNPADNQPVSLFLEHGLVDMEGPVPMQGEYVGPCPWKFRTFKCDPSSSLASEVLA